jgi:hypothetical protein
MNEGLSLIRLGLVGLVAGLGAYFGSYLKTKGKNLATQEDIAKLTQTTKQIEAKISNEMWDRQKRWELKREVLEVAAKRVMTLETTLRNMAAASRTADTNKAQGSTVYQEMLNEANDKWFAAKADYEETKLFLDSICGAEMNGSFEKYGKLAQDTAYKLNNGDMDILKNNWLEIVSARNGVRDAIRKELLNH